jgi:glycolate oxidase FAD binding subunit
MRRAVAEIVGKEFAAGDDPVVARPADVEQLGRVVGLCHKRGWTIRPRGGGTRPDECPWHASVVLDTTRLGRVVAHSPEDLVASVECGVRFADLQATLAAKGQRVPLDPPAAPESTVGGVLATGAFGPLRLGHGTLRDRVIGATLVRFDGEVVSSGGMVVKNVSGYDLAKLHVGARGSLGVLVRVNLKLAPAPEGRYAVATEAGDADSTWHEFAAQWNGPSPPVAAVVTDGCLTMGFESTSTGRATEETPFPALPDWVGVASFVARLHYPPAAWPSVARALPAGRAVSLLGSGVTFCDAAPLGELHAIAAAHGGFAVPERGAVSAGIVPADAAALMAGIKSALDPRSIFPPVPGLGSS